MDRHLKSNTVKTRTHSLFRQGCMLYELIPTMPAVRLRPLMKMFSKLMLEHKAFSDTFAVKKTVSSKRDSYAVWRDVTFCTGALPECRMFFDVPSGSCWPIITSMSGRTSNNGQPAVDRRLRMRSRR